MFENLYIGCENNNNDNYGLFLCFRMDTNTNL